MLLFQVRTGTIQSTKPVAFKVIQENRLHIHPYEAVWETTPTRHPGQGDYSSLKHLACLGRGFGLDQSPGGTDHPMGLLSYRLSHS